MSPRTGSTPPQLEEKRRDGPRQFAAPTAVPAKRQWYGAKRPDLTVMAHLAAPGAVIVTAGMIALEVAI
jgi:hypothetical protein